MFMWVLPILWVPMDVTLSGHSELAKTINGWCISIFAVCQLMYVWLVAPILLAYYETDANEKTC